MILSVNDRDRFADRLERDEDPSRPGEWTVYKTARDAGASLDDYTSSTAKKYEIVEIVKAGPS
jgi:hypothetical protein